jgi:tetratricopeptide (TPR) repeat protein
VEQMLLRLPSPAQQMLCVCSVFRRPVPISFWLAMLLEEKPEVAFDTLQDRHLVEFVVVSDAQFLVRQHNLIRSVAYDSLKANISTWHQAECKAADLWLTAYKSGVDDPNLEIVRGYLEAFEHYYAIKEWRFIKNLLETKITISDDRSNHVSKIDLCWRLHLWGYYREEILLCEKILIGCQSNIEIKKLEASILSYLGLAFNDLGDFPKAIEYHQQHSEIAKRLDDTKGEGNALGNLGIAYDNLGEFIIALGHHQRHLEIAEKIGDLECKSNAMGNLGNTYLKLKQYDKALALLNKSLTIRREIRNSRGESYDLGSLGKTYYELGRYDEALDLHNQALAIRIRPDINDYRGQGDVFYNIGKTQLKLRNYLEALTQTQKALKIFQEIGDRNGESKVLRNLAELHQALNNIELARQYCQQALELAIKIGVPLVAECQTLMESLD